MKKALENSCARGCLVYVVALIAVLGLTSLGLGGLGARLGLSGGANKPQASALSEARQPIGAQAPQSAAPAGDAGAGQQAAPTPTPGPVIVVSLPTVQIVLQPAGTPVPQVPQQSGLSGEISGGASAPFYIVQSGDTLWSIAVEYGVEIEGLRSVNNLPDNIIKPGQLLYLPPVSAPQSAPQPAPAPAPPAQEPGGTVPSMPNTGINKGP